MTKRIVGIRGGGHLSVTDRCHRDANGHSELEVAEAAGVCGVALLDQLRLNDCGTLDRAAGTGIVNDVTTAALEEALLCQDRSQRWSTLEARVSLVDDFRQ